MFKRYTRRFGHALRGIYHAASTDFSFQTQIVLCATVLICVSYFFRPLVAWEYLLLIGACVLILVTELQNSALEAALDKLHPEIHGQIKDSKDLAAGSVLMSGLYLLLVIAMIASDRFIF